MQHFTRWYGFDPASARGKVGILEEVRGVAIKMNDCGFKDGEAALVIDLFNTVKRAGAAPYSQILVYSPGEDEPLCRIVYEGSKVQVMMYNAVEKKDLSSEGERVFESSLIGGER